MLITPNQLLNTKIQAVGVTDLSLTVEKSRAYYENNPYPTYGPPGGWPYSDDKKTQVYPKVVTPLPRIVVDKSATFLMKEAPRFWVKDNATATEAIRRTIEESEIDFRACAQTAGIEGGLWFKFYTYGLEDWRVVPMGVEEVTPIYDPHDQSKLLMIRVQYQYIAPDNVDWWYREEWTDSEYVVYQEIRGSTLRDDRAALEHARKGDASQQITSGPWYVASRVPNRFGTIPFVLVKNKVDALNPNGAGDYWDLWHLFDRINVAFDAMDQSNQFAGGPVAAFIEADNAPTTLNPHETVNIAGPNAKVQLLEPSGEIRRHMEWYADKLESMLYSASGIVNPKLEDVAGLGQLSFAALTLLHGPIIELTELKRQYWAKWGLEKLFAKMLRARGFGQVEVTSTWADYFPLGGVDRQIELGNIEKAISIGCPFDVAVQWLGRILGIPEDQLPEFLKKAEADMEARQKLMEAIEMLNATAKGQEAQATSESAKPGLQTQAAGGGAKGAARKS